MQLTTAGLANQKFIHCMASVAENDAHESKAAQFEKHVFNQLLAVKSS